MNNLLGSNNPSNKIKNKILEEIIKLLHKLAVNCHLKTKIIQLLSPNLVNINFPNLTQLASIYQTLTRN